MFYHVMKTSWKIILLVVFISASIHAHAEDITARKTFELAEKYLLHGNQARFNELYKQLHFYPLQPYLLQKKLLKTLNIKHQTEIAEFLDTYQNTPLDWPLRKQWLTYLAEHKYHSLYLKYYKPTSDATLTCQFHLYQLAAGVSETLVLPQVTQLWTVGKSQPKACDPLFNIWQQRGYQTPEVVWQRLKITADGGKASLLPYLIKQLPKSMQAKGQLWRSVRINPSYVARLSRFPNKDLAETEMVTYALKRYIWRDPDHAVKVFNRAQQLFPFEHQQIKAINERFAIALSSKGHQLAKTWLDKLSSEQYSGDLVQWHITELLRDQNWPLIKQALLEFPQPIREKLQWRYWYARSLMATGEEERAKAEFSSLAKERHYYGFLAAGSLNQAVNLKHMPVAVSEQEKFHVLNFSEGKRAFELFHLNRPLQARSEWNFWMKQLTKREKLVAAKLAYDIGWYDRAIFTLAGVGYLNDIELRFPLAFEEDITEHANNHNIQPAWAFAITRRESSFMTDAHSSVGASGLMQIMPATAKQIAKKRVSKQKLYQPNDNIELGTKYLQQLLTRYNNNQILATAAYNAGPHRVKSWLKERPTLPADIWIETIPYKETREYVKSVMAYQQIYLLKLGEDQPLFEHISKMKI